MYSMPAILNEDKEHYFVRFLYEGKAWISKIPKAEYFQTIKDFFGVPLEELSAYLFELSKLDDTDDSVGSHYVSNGQIVPIGEKPKKKKKEKEIKQLVF